MPEEFFYLQQLFRGSGEGWIEVTLLASLFLVLVFKPERIRNRGLFLTACLLFALAIIVPPALQLCVGLLAGSLQSVYQAYRSMPIGSPIVLSLLGVVKPALLGGASGALSIAARARETGQRVVFSTFVDGAVGRALPLALAAAVGAADEVHGLGTGPLLARDLGPAERLGAGGFAVEPGTGIGFEPSGPDLEATPVFEVGR